MITNKTIGRMTCPICGLELQDVRISEKTKGLYVYCDNNCRVWFNKSQNAKYIPLLQAGQDVNDGKIYIKSLMKGQKQDEKISGTNETRTRTVLHANTNGSSTGSAAAAGSNTGSSTGSAAAAGPTRIELDRRQSGAGPASAGNDTGSSTASKIWDWINS